MSDRRKEDSMSKANRNKLIRQDVPLAAFDLARERTSKLIDEAGFFYKQAKYTRNGDGDALGDMLANAYLQGVTDTAAVLAKNPVMSEPQVDLRVLRNGCG